MDAKDILTGLFDLIKDFEDFECTGNPEECATCSLNVEMATTFFDGEKPTKICDVLCELTDYTYFDEIREEEEA